ncbi:pentatricopeptide repeat-containing protein At1g02150 [Nymphaea colorata]|nr:pentatricopeptide repeat-containing protein At1g02150 [Nymphaea colorata]
MNCQSHKPSFNPLQFPSCAPRFPLVTLLSFSHALRRNPFPLSLNSSFTQVHNYGTIDYESREAWNWRSLYRRIATMRDPNFGSSSVLNWWRKEGRKVSSWELRRIIKELRKFRRFKLALEVYDWIFEHYKDFKVSSSDIAIQLDLISKVYGISDAEEFFMSLAENSKNEKTYGALLNAYVNAKAKDKAEVLIKEMRSEGYLSHALPFNDIMTLYMKTNEFEKVDSMIQEMRKRNIALDIYSYNIWITTCAATANTEKMEEVFNQMKLDKNVSINWTTYSTLAAMYARLGLFQKADNCLKELESRISGRDRKPYNHLISLYANIGKKEEVYRIWKSYKTSFESIPNSSYHSMMSSLVRLGDLNGAEEVYEEWELSKSTYDPRICNVLLASYVREGMLEKAEMFVEHFCTRGGRSNPTTWEILAEGFIKQQEIEKALSAMSEAASIKKFRHWQPKPKNVESIAELCKEKGDATSAELLIEILRKVKYLDTETYDSLTRACNKSGKPV